MTDAELRELARKPLGTVRVFEGGAVAMADALEFVGHLILLIARSLRLAHYLAQAREKHHKM